MTPDNERLRKVAEQCAEIARHESPEYQFSVWSLDLLRRLEEAEGEITKLRGWVPE